MELHHKLRRDPSWHPSACNICGQLGHQAVNCTNGTINWRQIYGDEAFILREPIYWSEIVDRRKAKEIDLQDLEKKAREHARAKAEAAGLDYEEILHQAQTVFQGTTMVVAQPGANGPEPAADELPAGWATATDPQGRVYYWHKKTQKTTWEKPTADTPIE